MADLIRVKDNGDLAREKNSGAIVNTSREQFMSHLKRKSKQKSLETRVATLESKLDQIINILLTTSDKS